MRFFKQIVFFVLIILGFFFYNNWNKAFAQETNPPQIIKQNFYTAKILQVVKQGNHPLAGYNNPYQILKIQFLDGPQKGETITMESGVGNTLNAQNLVKKGDMVVITQAQAGPGGKPIWVIYDKYRLNDILYLAIAFFILVVFVAGKKGIGSLVGLGVSLGVIIYYIVPNILAGQDPLFVSVLGAVVILFITTYLAHGVSKQTTVALLSTFVALMLTVGISYFAVHITNLSGLNDETSLLLFGPTSKINLQGLLLAGIIIGTLGALNDITTSQSATIFELSKTDTNLKFMHLFTKGLKIGREHVVSMVNTLVLAYAGVSLIIFIFIVLNPLKVPYWVIINNELLSDEIIRTLAGSAGLVLVVPIVTALAAAACNKEFKNLFK